VRIFRVCIILALKPFRIFVHLNYTTHSSSLIFWYFIEALIADHFLNNFFNFFSFLFQVSLHQFLSNLCLKMETVFLQKSKSTVSSKTPDKCKKVSLTLNFRWIFLHDESKIWAKLADLAKSSERYLNCYSTFQIWRGVE
jgi:hypothetical protein